MFFLFCRTKTALTDKFSIPDQVLYQLRILFEDLAGDVTQGFTFHFYLLKQKVLMSALHGKFIIHP